ncbi:glycoside hydrolase family 108 protein [Chrysiogenes arsenatis]|uniref:glycoside hydrolase family 108 protein n=1 Tax=Chrysiogenes arsenatis TaxID=309797 RepID=UPI0003FA83CE|nr:glycosyl hydrolase 108 family protein [Chrysiogenes arsenatis]
MSDKRIEHIIDSIIAVEGGYVNDPNDRGGETNFGITIAVARANGYHGAMIDMPVSFARDVYYKRYVVAPKFDSVAVIDAEIGYELIDTGVNMGTATASLFLQRWLNGFRSQRAPYGELFIDGVLGSISLDALKQFLGWRGKSGKTALLRGLNGVQSVRYLEITERDKSQRDFLFGWIVNRVVM